jgi:NAD(P)H-dependent flavin oxidoreductase YrpB (nitropropane dioxygenase family)
MNRVLAHTGAKYPIVQAPMGWIAHTQLASAVSRAGGLGIIETSSGETEACQAEIEKMKALNLPFGVNLPIRFLRDDAMLKFVCNSGVKFVTTSAGSPAKFIAPLKSERTRAIYEEGLMAPDALKGIRDVYFHGDMEAAPALAGQSAGLIGEVKPARQIIEETVAQFFAIIGRLGGLASAQSFG